MSKTTVRKALALLDEAALRELVMELYAARKDAREYLEFWSDPDIDKAFEQASDRMRKLFYLPSGKTRAKVTATAVTAELKNFKSLCPDPEKTAYLLLDTAELMLRWIKDRGGKGMAAFRPRIDNVLKQARQQIDDYDLDRMMGERLDRITEYVEDFYNHFEPLPDRRGWRRYLRFT